MESLSSDVEVFGSLMVEWDVDIEVILVGSWIGVGVCCACSAKGSGEGVCRLVSSSGIFVGARWGYVSWLRIYGRLFLNISSLRLFCDSSISFFC